MSSSGSYGGGSKPHVLYGVWIDQALQSNDANQMREVLQEVRKQYPSGKGGGGTIIPLYGVFINRCIESGASREELEALLEQAKSVKNSDLDNAISKLEAHLGKK
jgi:hypothetical protein